MAGTLSLVVPLEILGPSYDHAFEKDLDTTRDIPVMITLFLCEAGILPGPILQITELKEIQVV